jgi:hypothetical protein
MTIPSTLARQREEKINVKIATKIVFEAEGFENERRAHQAAAIIKRALHPNTVLFEIDATDLSKDDVYDLITKEIGEATGFRPISEYRGNGRGNWLIEAKFRDTENAKKACEKGLTHQGINYMATPSIENAEKRLTKVNLTHLPLEHQDEIKAGLMHSMEKYGQVCQIKLYTTARGHFEGEAAVLLDTTQKGEDHHSEELTRMIYLEKWDNYHPATFKGAPPVCYMCRLSGHVKKDCPEMAKIRCFKCNENGHMRKDCTNERQQKRSQAPDTEDLSTTTERIGMKRQRNDSLTAAEAKELHQKSDSDQGNTKEIQQEHMCTGTAETTVIAVEDKQIYEESTSSLIWQDEPEQAEMDFEDLESEVEDIEDNTEGTERNFTEHMEEIDEPTDTTVDTPTMAAEKKKEKQKASWPSEYRPGPKGRWWQT